MNPADLGIPVSAFRALQMETIQAAANSPKKVTLIEGPPGAGKSVIAVALARYMGAKRTVILCHTKQLQQQYLSIPGLVTVLGRRNFPCAEDSLLTADDAACTVCGPRKCPAYQDHKCAYYNQIRAAMAAPISVHNYPFWFRDANHTSRFSDLDLLVCDEAHLLEDMLSRTIEVRLGKAQLRTLGLSLPAYGSDSYSEWRFWAERTASNLSSEATGGHDFETMTTQEVTEAQALKAVYETVSRLVLLNDDWLIERDLYGVTFRPVWVKEYGNGHIFDHAKKVVLLSATILDAGHFVDGLGIPDGGADFLQLPSTFPAERRPIIIRPVAKVDRNMGEADEAALVRAIDAILERHPGQKGIVHSASYALSRLVLGRTQHAGRLVTHDGSNRLTQVEMFRRSLPEEGLVMVSPSLTTGLDLPYDDLRFQIIAKVPYPNLGDERVKRRMKKGPDGFPNPKGQAWYIWQALCTMLQAYGRVMRAEDDAGTTYILDAHVKTLLARTKKIMPGWVTDAITWEVPTERYESEMDKELVG